MFTGKRFKQDFEISSVISYPPWLFASQWCRLHLTRHVQRQKDANWKFKSKRDETGLFLNWIILMSRKANSTSETLK